MKPPREPTPDEPRKEDPAGDALEAGKEPEAPAPAPLDAEGGPTLLAHEGSDLPPPAPRTPSTWNRGSVLAYVRSRFGISKRPVETEGGHPLDEVAGPGAEDRYAGGRELGRGGMGAILEIFDRDIRRPVAMKVILGEEDPARIERFIEEAQVTGQLEHPNIVPVHELGVDGRGRAYFTMKRVEGESLQAIIDRIAEKEAEALEAYPLSQLLQIFLKVCDAVAFAHSRGIVHRDLKPENVMVGRFGEVLVMDWGLAKVRGREDAAREALVATIRSGREVSRTLDGQVMGTPSFMPPEQADGKLDEIDERSDVWALSAILYALLCHEAPHTGETVMNVLARALKGEVPPPRKRSPWLAIPRELEGICMKGMASRKEDRYASVESLGADVRAFLDRRLVSAHRYGLLERVTRWVQRHPTTSMGLGVGGLLLAAGAALSVVLVQEARLADLRRQEAEREKAVAVDKAETAESLLKKGRRVSAVMQRARIELEPVLRALEASYHSVKPLDQKRKAWKTVSSDVQAFDETVPGDNASRASWLALEGWLRHLGGFDEEAQARFRESVQKDADVAYGRLFEAMVAAVKFLGAQRMPVLALEGGRFQIREVAEESERVRRHRERFESLLGRVGEAGVWGQSSAKEFETVLAGLDGIRGGDPKEAEDALGKALGIPEMIWIESDLLLARAKVRRILGAYEGMEKDLDRLQKRFPDHIQARYERGQLRLAEAKIIMGKRLDSRPKYLEALQLFDGVAKEDPGNLPAVAHRALVNLLLARIHAHRNLPFRENFKACFEDFDRLLERDPENLDYRSYRGFAYKEYAYNVGRYGEPKRPWFEKAHQDFSRILEADPGNVKAYCDRAEVRMGLGTCAKDPSAWFEKARADCREALAIRPGTSRCYTLQSQAYFRQAQFLARRMEDARPMFEKAAEMYDRLLEKKPGVAAWLLNRGMARGALAEYLMQRGEDALAVLRASVEDLALAAKKDPRDGRVHETLAMSLTMLAGERARKGEDVEKTMRRALKHFDRAVRIDKGYWRVRLNRASGLIHLANLLEDKGEDAREYLERALADCDVVVGKAPKLGRTYAIRASIHRRLAEAEDEPEKADALLEKCLADCETAVRLHAADWNLLLCKGRALLALERRKEALEALEAARKIVGDGNEALNRALAKARDTDESGG